jgi:UDP-2-acetamido-3-amino-2,3-dideoxy-glucuronate N-acetyltransferase
VAVGRCALVGAGAVVTRDVRAHALVVGNPARQVGWVGCTGRTLVAAGARGGELRCPGTGRVYRLLEDGELHGCEAAATAP